MSWHAVKVLKIYGLISGDIFPNVLMDAASYLSLKVSLNNEISLVQSPSTQRFKTDFFFVW